jgi:2-amino-4-hydroxy-6-hydroxymethyldihydropteridine diphosphokinase
MFSAVDSDEPNRVVIGLGANEGEPLRQLATAIQTLSRSVAMHHVSSVYLSSPVGVAEQPDFYNMVCTGSTLLGPEELLAELLRIELGIGRVRRERFGPRRLDLDLLSYGTMVRRGNMLEVPHPRMHLRRFVLEPLLEVSPGWRHPVSGKSPAQLLGELDGKDRVVRLGDLRELTEASR